MSLRWYVPRFQSPSHLTKSGEDFDEHRWNDTMAWPSSSEGGPSELSRADAAYLAAEEEISTGVLPQVLAVCTCLQIALMLLVMHRHSCVPPYSPKRNAASKLQAGAARQVARLSVAGRVAPGRLLSTSSKRGRPPDSLGCRRHISALLRALATPGEQRWPGLTKIEQDRRG